MCRNLLCGWHLKEEFCSHSTTSTPQNNNDRPECFHQNAAIPGCISTQIAVGVARCVTSATDFLPRNIAGKQDLAYREDFRGKRDDDP
jgi:hypothetical protein